jgi:hypothetical protein
VDKPFFDLASASCSSVNLYGAKPPEKTTKRKITDEKSNRKETEASEAHNNESSSSDRNGHSADHDPCSAASALLACTAYGRWVAAPFEGGGIPTGTQK